MRNEFLIELHACQILRTFVSSGNQFPFFGTFRLPGASAFHLNFNSSEVSQDSDVQIVFIIRGKRGEGLNTRIAISEN